MLKKGAVEEVKTLLAKNPPSDSPVMKAIGVYEIKSMLSCKIIKSEVIDLACRGTRNYAKRQVTWFKHRFFADMTVADAKSPEILTKALRFLG